MLIKNLDDFKIKYPKETALLQQEVHAHVMATEKELIGAESKKKQEHAIKLVLDAVYDAADSRFNFDDNTDFIVKSFVIPALPNMIDSAVKWFNEQRWFEDKQ